MAIIDKKFTSRLKTIPKKPGVYQFLNKNQAVIYIGKAKNLRVRIAQYFSGRDGREQVPYLLKELTDFSYTVVNSELESLYLENTLIKQFQPKYNILLRDDKNYAFITIDFSTQIPAISFSRKIDPKNKKIKYFGPYSAAYKIRSTLNLVRKIFPYCSAAKVSSRPCFYYYLHRCPGVCVGKISLADYGKQLENIALFLAGDNKQIIKQIRRRMQQAAMHKKFEAAARLRDQLRALLLLEEKQNVILTKAVSWDMVSLAIIQATACINLFKIRGGKLIDKENFIFQSKIGIIKPEPIIQAFLTTYYLEASNLPKEIYLQFPAENELEVRTVLTSRAKNKIYIHLPKKGKARQLVKLGEENAREYLEQWLKSQTLHVDNLGKALQDLKEILNLPARPGRIEGYDISNLQGTNPVGSMVVVIDGKPAKSQYRKFKIQKKATPDDFAMMQEMLERRLNNNWPLPDLIVIDGGKGQLAVAAKTLKKIKLKIPVIGLAKRIEEIFVPEKKQPLVLEHRSPALQLLQRLRDEAHRFGVTFHRALRSKQAVKSALDDIAGLGPKNKKLLKEKFGTVANIKTAGLNEIAAVVGERLAQKIKASL